MGTSKNSPPNELSFSYFEIKKQTMSTSNIQLILSSCLNKLSALGDPLIELNANIDWEAFRSDLSKVYAKPRKSNAGAKPIDVVLMFKILVLQSIYGLSDEKVEYQIRDRLSFMRFLNIDLGGRVPCGYFVNA